MSKSPIVLVPGAALGPWLWESVAPLLADGGYEVHTPELAGTTQCNEYEARDISATTWADNIADYLMAHDLESVTVVAHDIAGLAMGPLVENSAELLSHIIFADAMVPAPGDTGWASVPDSLRTSWQARLGADGQGWIPWFDHRDLAELYPEDPMSNSTAEWIRSFGLGVPVGVLHEVQPAVNHEDENITVTYLKNPHHVPAKRYCPTPPGVVLDSPAGHWAMLTAPELFTVSIAQALTCRVPAPRADRQPEFADYPLR